MQQSDRVMFIRNGSLKADTINVGPGHGYDVIWTALKPGKWPSHCHIGQHITNNDAEMQGGGGVMVLIDVAGSEPGNP